jgi:hypothetical protein
VRHRVTLARFATTTLCLWLLAVVAGAVWLTFDTPAGNPVNPGRGLVRAVDAATLTGLDFAWQTTGSADVVVNTLVGVGVAACWMIGVAACLAMRATSSAPSRTWPPVLVAIGLVAFAGAVGPLLRGDLLDAIAGFGRMSSTASPTYWFVDVPLVLLGLLVPFAAAGFVVGWRPVWWNVLGVAALICVATVALLPTVGADAGRIAFGMLAPSDAMDVASIPARWSVALLGLVGTVGGGTGGGLKVTTLLLLAAAATASLRGRPATPLLGIALVWLGCFALLGAATFVALLATLPEAAATDVALLASAAVANHATGPPNVTASGSDATILAGAMLLGRLLPWIVLCWSATQPTSETPVG